MGHVKFSSKINALSGSQKKLNSAHRDEFPVAEEDVQRYSIIETQRFN